MKVLVLGGTGHVGREVVRRQALGGDEVCFTWHQNAALAAALPGRGIQVDLSAPGAAQALFTQLEQENFILEGLAHCARLRPDPSIDEVAQMSRALHLWAEAALLGVRALAPGPDVHNAVLLCAWSPGQSLPLAPWVAAAQGALVTLTMALGRELAGRGVRVNAVALGLLDGGAAAEVAPAQVESYRQLSALRRVGTAAEVAATVVGLIRENRIMNGKVLASNGGI